MGYGSDLRTGFCLFAGLMVSIAPVFFLSIAITHQSINYRKKQPMLEVINMDISNRKNDRTRASQVSISPGDLLLWQTIYYCVERVVRSIHRYYFRDIHAALVSSRKDLPFFGVAMGFIITLFSSPFCISAFFDEGYNASSLQSTVFPRAVDICATSRAVLWISELSRLGDNSFYLIHHLFSLAVLGYFLANKIPMTMLNLVFGTLVTELASDPVYLLEAHGNFTKSSWWTRNLESLVLLLYVFVRLPPVWYGWYWLNTVGSTILSGGEIGFCALFLVVYFAFNLYCIFKLAVKKGLLSMHAAHAPESIRFGKHIWTLYGLYMGFGLSCLAAVSLIVYSAALSPVSYSLGGTRRAVETMPMIILVSILGARLMSLIFEDGLQGLIQDSLSAILRPGFWLHGGIIGGAVALWSSRDIIPEVNLLVSSIGIALPLYEFFGRVGCSSYGCCYGRPVTCELTTSSSFANWLHLKPVIYNFSESAALRQNPSLKGIPLFPVQKVSALLYLIQFFIIITGLFTGWFSVGTLGGISFSVHSLIRLMMEPYRADFRGGGSGWTVTGVIAGVQMIVGIVLAVNATGTAGASMDSLVWQQVPWSDIVFCGEIVFSFSGLIYGYNHKQIGRWI